jgi:hypothetical protein
MNERALLPASHPDIADTSHASQRAVEFFHGYFTAKSRHDAEGWLRYFHPSRLAYYDATLGLGSESRSVIEEQFGAMVSGWPEDARSYPLRILGDSTSAVVVFVDTFCQPARPNQPSAYCRIKPDTGAPSEGTMGREEQAAGQAVPRCRRPIPADWRPELVDGRPWRPLASRSSTPSARRRDSPLRT